MSPTCSCSMCARRSMAAAPRPIVKGHIPGAIHSDYDKAGWRVTRGGVPFMLPTLARAGKADRRARHRRGHACGRRAGGRASHGFRIGGAHLLDAQGRGRDESLDPRWRLRGLGRGEATRSRPAPSKPSPKIFTATLNKALLAEAGEVAKIEQSGGATLIDLAARLVLRRQAEGAGREGLWPHSGRRECRQRDVLRRATNRLKPQAELAAIAATLPGRPGGHLLQHRPLGGDRLVRALRAARPQATCGSITARWSTGPRMRAARSPRRAPSGMT